MINLGIDLGNAIIKTSEGVQFPSKFTTESDLLGKDNYKLQFNGKIYYVGTGATN